MAAERVIVAGAGIGGLGAALALGRAGHQVLVLDRDDLTVAPTPDEAFAIGRKGAPQVRHTHGLLARLTGLLRDRFPDVLATLLEAGATEAQLTSNLGEPEPGDELLHVLFARRTTLEWALRRATDTEANITLRGDAAIDGLVGEPAADGRPAHVRGVRLASGEVIEADVVVSAGGRRAGVPAWLAPLGVAVDEIESETGIVYLTRWYRTPDDAATDDGTATGAIEGDHLVKLGGDLGFLFYLAVPADRGAFSLTMAIGADDSELRAHLLDPAAFDRAAAQLPLPDGLLAQYETVGPVHPMGGLVNRIRRFTDGSGQPLVTGFHAVGDAHTCTNPIYGRGCSLALVQGISLADATLAHPGDPIARAVAYEAACAALVEPWYELGVQTDRMRAKARHAARDGAPPAESMGLERIMQAGSDDPIIGRGILRVMNLLATPAELMADPVFMTRAMELVAAMHDTPTDRWARTGPTRDDLLGPVDQLTA